MKCNQNKKQEILQSMINNNTINNELSAIGVIDFDSLISTIEDLYAAFPNNFHHTFAVKANALVGVLKQIRKTKMGAEVASPGELKIALAAGFKVDDIIYDSPAKTMDDLRTCIKNGISINIDNLQELSRIDQLMSENPDSRSIIGFRINPQIGTGKISSTSTATSTSKFGYTLSDGNNREKLIEIYKQRPWLQSIHIHSGSQGCSLDLMVQGVAVITDLAEEINANTSIQQVIRLDIGGGLAVNFSSDEITPTFKEYADLLEENVPLLFNDKYQVKTEFGRAIVAKNGLIITRVEYTKNSGGRHIAITHAGAQTLTRTVYMPKDWPLRVTVFNSEGHEKTSKTDDVVTTDIAGPCCFAGDMICVNQQLPEMVPNDYVMVHDTGGYYFSNHFDYNSLPKLAVYSVSSVDNDFNINCIRQADSLDDVLNKM